MQLPPISLEISLLQSGGEVRNPGNLQLVCNYRATHFPDLPLDAGGRVSVLAKDRISERWVEYRRETGREFAAEIQLLILQLGMPERMPRVHGAFDTCDSWTGLLLHIQIDGKRRTLAIDVQCGGFEGPDAGLLRQLLQKLFLAAGYESHSRSVYGFQ